MMHILLRWAMRWELIPLQINPINLVHIKGSSKRERELRTLTTEEFRRFIEHVPEPCRTMCLVTACLGLRVSETLGLKWDEFDWNDLRVKIQRSWVAGVEDDVKTQYSKKWMPLCSDSCRARARAQGKDLPAGKGDKLGLCQPGDWKTVLARTLTGTLSRSCWNEGSDRARWLAYISPQLFDSSASVWC
jgi:integrase